MGDFTLITDEVTTIDAVTDADGHVWVPPSDLAAATGWTLEPVGLCQGDRCIPTDLNPGLVGDDGRVDLARLAPLAGGLLVVDAAERVAVLGASAGTRAAELASGLAPDFTLPDLDGEPFSLDEMRGRKTLVVAFASWCGCRYDLPAWQALDDELAPDGLEVVAVAIDEDPAAVRPFTEGIGMPVLIDRDRTFAERYALTNVPAVVWIDEEGRLVRPPDVAFGSEDFVEYHKIDSADHREALRRWVREGTVPADAGGADRSWTPTDEEQLAHLHYRLALHLWRAGAGHEDAAARHFDRAAALAPLDFTVRRAQLPLRGKDPFLGEEFQALFAEWEQAGRPYHGKPRDQA